jgi:hypothetical protein
VYRDPDVNPLQHPLPLSSTRNMDAALAPEGHDSTIGDEPTETGHGPEELDDVTDDGSTDGGTLADGDTTDALDDILDNHSSAGWSSRTDDENPVATTSDGEEDGDEHLPDELDADAMGRPLNGSLNDDDQGMQNAGENLGD